MTGVCLRGGVLEGRCVVRLGAAGIGDSCVELGAEVLALTADPLDEDAVTAEVAAIDRADAVLADAAGLFGTAGGGYEGLRRGLDGCWNVVRAVANAQLITAGAGQIVLLAPGPGAGDHAGALRAGLENMARTLSTEWTRHRITTVAVLPGDATQHADLAELVAFLLSEAGAYYSGAALTLA